MIIARNRKVNYDYFIEEKFEAGIVLSGWEVKAIRAKKVQLKESYVIVRQGQMYLLNAHISPLISASSHKPVEPTRTRKLLLHKRQINKLVGLVERSGYTLVAIDLHFKSSLIKLELGLAKGKKLYDKRQSERDNQWKREKQRILKQSVH